MHCLLGIARTAEGALAAAPAADDVPMDRLTVETEGVHPLVEELGVPSDDLPRHGADAERALHLVEVGRHGGGVRALQPVATFPLAEYAIRCPEAGAGVDDRRPAHALAEGDGERRSAERDRGAAVPVEALHPLEGRTDEVPLREVGALLENDDAEAGTRELAGDHRTARARSDHAGVGGLLDRAAHRGELERPEPRPRTRRTVVETVVLVAERGLDPRVGAERREADHAEQHEGHPSPRCAACRALLDPGAPCGRREAAERSEMPRGERACLPGTEEHAQLGARRRREAREVGPHATDHVHLRGADGEGPTRREESFGERRHRARLGAGEHARAP